MTAGQHSRLPRESESETGGRLPGGEQSGLAGPVQVSRDDVRLALHKVLNSPEFSSVVQLRSFLNYVVSKAIEDRLDEIKGYTIAVEALGRDVSFNPVTDPIVRVEAARLRRRLTKYYTGSGKKDPVVIEIPKGSYVPVFEVRRNGIGSTTPSPDTIPEQTGRPCEDANPARLSWIAGQIPSVTDSAIAKVLSETPASETAALAECAKNRPATAANVTIAAGTDPHKVRLPVAIGIMVLAFVAGYAFGAFL